MTREQSTGSVGQTWLDDASPDSLMGDFRGRPIVVILAFTVIVHVVLIGVFSMGYLKNQLLGDDTSAMSKEQRMDSAVREATTSLREIAERHDVSPQELSDRFAKGDLRSASTASPPPAQGNGQPAEPVTSDAATKPKSAIENELQKKAVGPELPELPPDDEEDDLFD